MKPVHSKEISISVKIFTNHNLTNEEFEEIFTSHLNKINSSLFSIETELNENAQVRTHIESSKISTSKEWYK